MISNEEEDANGGRERRLRAATNEITNINLKAFLAAELDEWKIRQLVRSDRLRGRP